MIKFSVIVPLYNCEKYIKECIDSILGQQYTNFELVVVNDGSTDNSREIVQTYADERIRIIDKENGGLLHARLTGLKEAKNDYIVFVDADDRISSTLLEDLARYFSNGIDCVIYKLKEFSETGEKEASQGVFPDKTIFEKDDRKKLLKLLFTTGRINSIVCKAFKKVLIPIQEMEEYPRIAIGEDGLFSLHLLENYTNLIYLDCAYYQYRQSSQSMTHKLRFSNYTDNVFRFKLYYQLASKHFEDGLEDIIFEIDRVFFTMIISTLIKPRAYFENKADYSDIVNRIRETEIFQKKMKSSFRKQSIAYRVILRSIEKGKIGRLLFFRCIVGLIYKN